MSLILVLLLNQPLEASTLKHRFKSWCERNIVAQDPYPWAEYRTQTLIALYRVKGDETIAKELKWRAKKNVLITEDERDYVINFLLH